MSSLPELHPALTVANNIAEQINQQLPRFNVKQADARQAVHYGSGNCFARTVLAMEELDHQEIPHYFMQQSPRWLKLAGFHHAQVLIPVDHDTTYGLVLDTPNLRIQGQVTAVRPVAREAWKRTSDLHRLESGETVVMWDRSPGFGPVRMRTALPEIGLAEYQRRTGLTNRGSIA